MANMSGTILSKYKLSARLGSGGMAEVYQAYHEKLDRQVTIKILHSYLIEGEGFLERFEREARAVASLRHASIVQIHDYDHEDDVYFMVMELIDGGNLKTRLLEYSKDSRFYPVVQVRKILGQVSNALDYAHGKGIIHRDIKPSNVLLNKNGDAYLTDFGIARIMSDIQVTATGSLIGTPTYMSPEQGMGKDLTNTSDIYSLGVVLYELLTGKVPYTSDTPLAIIHQHINEPLPKPSLLRPDLPIEIENIVLKAIEKDPSNRYQTCIELFQAFDAALTQDLIGILDEGDHSSPQQMSDLPTMLDEGGLEEGISEKATELMGQEARAAIIGEPETSTKQEPDVPLEEEIPGQEAKGGSKTDEVPDKEPGEELEDAVISTKKPASKIRNIIIAAAAIVLLVVVAILISGNFPTNNGLCASFDECMAQQIVLWEQGDPYGAIESMDRAIGFVADDVHQDFAWVWYDRAVMLEEIGEFGEADISREMAAAWERGE
ncbi:serine/threonine protein kinase [Chloroflexota bacterium]